MFKHPTPEDFFRSMEDASAMDLDWFWRGWFYTTDFNDIGIKNVAEYRVTNKPTRKVVKMAAAYGVTEAQIRPSIFLSTDAKTEGEPEQPKDIAILKKYIDKKYGKEASVDIPSYFYEITFEKNGGLVLPILVEYTYEDGSKEMKKYPAQIWSKNDKEVKKLITSDKAIRSITVDPNAKTADVDTSNNQWPKAEKSVFDLKKEALSK